jgi:hypothetical protein
VLAALDELVGLEAVGEAEIFVADQLDAGEAVMDLGDVDVTRRHAGHRHGRLRGADGRRKRRHVGLVLVHDPVHAQPDPAYPDRAIRVAVHDVFRRKDDRGGAVALRGAVIEPERVDHHRCSQRLLDGNLVTQLRFRVGHRVEVVLHRHHRHVFFGRR